jgi:hypothetical protein
VLSLSLMAHPADAMRGGTVPPGVSGRAAAHSACRGVWIAELFHQVVNNCDQTYNQGYGAARDEAKPQGESRFRGAPSAAAEADNFRLHPPGNVQIEPKGRTRIVRVHASGVDLHDLFAAVLADLEERNDGLTGEID